MKKKIFSSGPRCARFSCRRSHNYIDWEIMGESDVDTLDINHLQLGDAHRSLAGPDPLLKKLETIAAAQHSSLILKSQELIIPSLDVELHS